MNPIPTNQARRIKTIFLTFFALLGLLASNTGGAFAGMPAALQGQVQIIDTTLAVLGPATDASVIAVQGNTIQKVNTDGSGQYTLPLPASGDWQVTVVPNQVNPITSPAWIYTSGPQWVHFDPSTTDLSKDFQVAQANALIHGQLLPPVQDPAAQFTNSSGSDNRAWVRAANAEGQGNTVQVNPDGTFNIHILPGNVGLRLALKNPLWAPNDALSGAIWTVAESEDLAISSNPYLQLLKKEASITGVVLDGEGHNVANIPVHAWRLDGSESQWTVSGIAGYTLTLLPGVWQVWAVPDDNQPFVSAEGPRTVALTTATDAKTVTLHIAAADASVSGQVVDKNNHPMPGIKGRVIPTYPEADGKLWRSFAQGAPITNGAYTLKLSSHVATTYRLHASFSDNSDVILLAAPVITVAPGTTLTDINLPVAANNSSISGHFVDHTSGEPWLDHPGAVYGASDGGAFKGERLNPVDGSYMFQVAASDVNGHGGTFWWLHAFVDPITQFFVQRPRTQKVFLPYNNGDGADVTGVDFTVAAMDARLQGKVTDWQGNPVRGARVSAWEQNTPAGLALNRWTLTDANGRYFMRLTAGTYRVRADHWKWLSPIPVVVTIASGETITQDLQFRKSDATINGVVSYNGAPHTALVRAISDKGAHAFALTNAQGQYILRVVSAERWHVQAVSEEGDGFLKSDKVDLIPVPGNGNHVNLALVESETLPEAIIFRFDATQEQIFTLSNGAQVIIPANAMASSGLVTLFVRPLAELADDGIAQPVSFGYRLLAFDESNMPIDHFNVPVTLSMPFTADQLAQLGVTAERLIPGYWDEATASWKPAANYSLMTGSNGGGSLLLQVSHFTDYSILGDTTTPHFIFLPAMSAK